MGRCRMSNRKRRRRMLVSGVCDFCENPASLPWKGAKLCYWCWNEIIEKEFANGKKKKKSGLP